MTFFNYSEPVLRRKETTLEIQELKGLWFVNWQIGKIKLYSTFYTRIDQACILWSILLIPMFVTAQFLPISWSLQATLWSILSLIGIVMMVNFTRHWVQERQVTWILYCWALLMAFGVILTNMSIFLLWGDVLMHLCPLWLGLSAIGYWCTGFAVRSRAIIFIGILHLLGIFLLPYVSGWQFLSTGALMVFCLLLLAEFQWDGL